MFALCCFAFTWQGMAQFTESFDTEIPTTWTVLNEDGGGHTWEHQDAYPHAGLGHVRIHWEDDAHEDYLITPQFTVTSGVSDRISFYAGIDGVYYTETFEVRLSTTGNSAADFTELLGSETATTNAAAGDYTKYEYNLSAYAGQQVYVAIVATDTDRYYLAVDEFVNDALPSCPAPSAMVASNVTSSSADLAWTAGNTETTWNLEWKAGADFTPGNGEEDGSDTVTGTPEYNGQLTGLTDNTTYYVYYQADCGGDSSSWASFSFQTHIEGPDNDMLSGAITLTLDEGTACGANAIVGISNAATNDSGEGDPSCDDQWSPSIGNGDLWYQFTAPAYEVTLSVSNISGLTSVSGVLYSGTSGNLTEIGTCGNSWPKTYATLTAGETYYLRLWDYGNDQTGTFDLCGYYLSCTPATVDFSVESICGDPSGDFNVVVDVTDMGSAASLDVQDDQGNPAQAATGATTLTFGPYANGTDVVITVTPDDNAACAITSDAQTQTICPPANDECDNAIALTVNADLNCGVVTSGTNLGATASSQTDDVVGTPNDDVWFSFVATSTLHEISLSNVVAVEGTSVDMAMGVYDATGGCANLVLVDDSDPNSFSVSGLTIGNTYLIRVFGYSSGSWSPSAKTTFDICVGTPPPPPANDDCANAIVINESDESCNNSVAGTTVSATNSADYDCSSYYNEVWYEFTPTTSGVYNVERTLTSGTSSTYLSIYSGSCGSLTQINSSCSSTSLEETLTAGETYLISVATYNSGSVDFELCVYPEPTCYAPDSFSAVFVAPDAADLSWEAPSEGTPTSYNWEVVPAGNGQGNGTIDSGNTTGLTVTASGLTLNTLYDLYVQSDCGGGDNSAWAGPFTFNAGYCLPSGTSSSSYIDNFTTTDASGVNIDNSASGFATDNYGDYFDTHTVSLAPEESFDFSFEIVGGTVGAAVWVDWNNDYNFDTTEVMFTTTTYGSGPFTGTIEVPAGTADGDYRMRVLIDWNDNNPGDDAACSFGNGRGEVEDYKITVDSSLSIIDVETSAFTYYPNPVKDKLTLNAQSNIQKVVVYNMLGQEVMNVSPNTLNAEVNMANLNSGAYFVKVSVNNATKTIRVIKN